MHEAGAIVRTMEKEEEEEEAIVVQFRFGPSTRLHTRLDGRISGAYHQTPVMENARRLAPPRRRQSLKARPP